VTPSSDTTSINAMAGLRPGHLLLGDCRLCAPLGVSALY
jgi:hypothetical protein